MVTLLLNPPRTRVRAPKCLMSIASLVSKVWSFANVLRDDGVGYGDYLEQITYLLFLKMADEQTKAPYNKKIDFPRLKDVKGKELEE